MRKSIMSVLAIAALGLGCSDPLEPPRMPPSPEEDQEDPTDPGEGSATAALFVDSSQGFELKV